MKKEINSKSRRKWIMGGLAAFASVALLTTGFAVWVVGVTQTKKDGDVTVDVDTAQNQSVTFALELDDKAISLKEKNTNDDSLFVKVTDNGDSDADFSITFSKFEISMPAGWFDTVKISFDTPSTSATEGEDSSTKKYVDNKVSDNNVKLKTDTRKNKTYFDLKSDTLSLTDETIFEASTTNSVTTYKYKDLNKSVDFFKWGSFFNEKAPSIFYNENIFGGNNPEKETAENAKFVEDELNAMKDTYTGKNTFIKLKFELTGGNQGKNN